jgi:hypothetical protein
VGLTETWIQLVSDCGELRHTFPRGLDFSCMCDHVRSAGGFRENRPWRPSCLEGVFCVNHGNQKQKTIIGKPRHIRGRQPHQHICGGGGGGEDDGEERRAQTSAHVLGKLEALYKEAFEHDGFAEIRVEMRILRRGQKEIILHCGKQYRFVVDCPLSPSLAPELPGKGTP